MLILVEEMVSSFQNAVERMRIQRQAENELFKLTDRELRDLGINRCDIYSIVYETYNKDK